MPSVRNGTAATANGGKRAGPAASIRCMRCPAVGSAAPQEAQTKHVEQPCVACAFACTMLVRCVAVPACFAGIAIVASWACRHASA